MKKVFRSNFYIALFVSILITVISLSDKADANEDLRCSARQFGFDLPMAFCFRTEIFIAAVGRITDDTPDQFIAFLKEARQQGHTPHSVTFHSPGGSVVGGMNLGRIIRALKLDTHVGESSECTSACVFAFVGGWSRKVTQNGRIGNHQIKNELSDVDRVETVQNLIALLSAYHHEMNVSPLAVTAAMQRRSDEMYWYSKQEQAEWGITTKR